MNHGIDELNYCYQIKLVIQLHCQVARFIYSSRKILIRSSSVQLKELIQLRLRILSNMLLTKASETYLCFLEINELALN